MRKYLPSVAVLMLLTASVEAAAQSSAARKDIPAIAKAAKGAVVTIITANGDKPVAMGTGFVVQPDGVIVTNYHVIKEGKVATVKFADGSTLPVDGVLAGDKVRDLAVLKIRGKNFRTVTLGNSDRIQIGEDVVAIGNPLGLELTVSNGILSGIRTDEKEGGKFLQITAPISHGSSGGPLFNMAGEVIGINSMFLEGGENLNFAIPVNDAKLLLRHSAAQLQALPNEPEMKGDKESDSNEDSMHIRSFDFAGQMVIVQFGNKLLRAKVTHSSECQQAIIETSNEQKDCKSIPPIAAEYVGHDIPTAMYLFSHPNNCAHLEVIGPSTDGTILFLYLNQKETKGGRCVMDGFETETWEIKEIQEVNR